MRRSLRFSRPYFVITFLLFTIEIVIARYAHDPIIRPYIGDLLVVILIYCFIKSFFNTPYLPTALAVLVFSYLVEILQYFHVVNWLGLGHSVLARIVIGTSFEWIDLLAYTIGIALVILVEKYLARKKTKLLPANG